MGDFHRQTSLLRIPKAVAGGARYTSDKNAMIVMIVKEIAMVTSYKNRGPPPFFCVHKSPKRSSQKGPQNNNREERAQNSCQASPQHYSSFWWLSTSRQYTDQNSELSSR
jgi:hypothetical protein